MMERTKVIGDISELVPILRVVNTKTKINVFKELISGWKTLKEIEKKYGEEGKEALALFENIKIVDSKWQSDEHPEKVYHSYYSSFHINASCPITEMGDVLAVVMMPDNEFKKIEEKIYELAGEKGKFVGDVAAAIDVSPTMLKGIIRRSTKLEYRGHMVSRKLFQSN